MKPGWEPKMLIVDSHCHLDFDGMAESLEATLERAQAAGVGLMVSISSRVSRIETLRGIAEQHSGVYFTVGTHPHNAHEELETTADDLMRLSQHPKCIGIGEVGLDYHYEFSSRSAQEKGFRTHIEAARRTGLPLVIHSREAEDDTIDILRDEMAAGTFRPLLHCFTSKARLAEAAVSMGGYVSFSGILTYKSADDIRATAKALPLDRILVETDTPYLAPVPFRGKPNEPAFVVKTLEVLAEIRNMSLGDMAKVTTDNFFRLFSKASWPPSSN
jgi:TatD DNase family protein